MENGSAKVKIHVVMTEQTLDAIIAHIRDVLSGICGVKRLGRFDFTKRKKGKLVKAINNLISSVQEEIKTPELPNKEKGIKVIDAIDGFLHSLIPEMPKEVLFIDYLTDASKQLLHESLDMFQHTNTKFSEYLASVEIIVKGLYIKGEINSVNEFLDSVSKSKDNYILLQSFLIGSQKHFGYLYKPTKNVTTSRIEKMAGIYHELAGHFEKQVRIMIGLQEIFGGSKADYEKNKEEIAGRKSEDFERRSTPFQISHICI